MLAIQVISAINLSTGHDPAHSNSSPHSTYRHQYYASIHFDNHEIYRTAICSEIADPIWQDVVVKSLEDLRGREKDHNRPLFLEYLKIYVHMVLEKNNTEVIGETRVSLSNLGTPQWYKLLKSEGNAHSSAFSPSKDAGLILLALTLTEDSHGEGRIVGYRSLQEELMNKRIQSASLFLNFDLSPLSLIGADPLPGPIVGEVILDRHETVEVEVYTGTNSFGDKYRVICRGTFYLTELRILYLTTSIKSFPPGYNFFDIPSVEAGDCRDESELLALRRTSFSIPLTSIQECKTLMIDSNTSAIQVTTRDAITTEFVVKKNFSKRRKGVMQTNSYNNGILPMSSSGFFLPECEPLNEHQKKLSFRSYRCGLQTEEVSPSLWCARVIDEIIWRIREDKTWVKWAKCLRLTVEEVVKTFTVAEFSEPDADIYTDDDENHVRSESNNSRKESTKWWKSCLHIPSVIHDYTRLDVEGGNAISQWWICTNNINYEICDTYPQTLVFPCCISDTDIYKASLERSRQRLPTLVWIHPVTRVPLCRSSQPLVGLSKAPEHDKKLCLAIQQSSSTKYSLRIADARPFINAQANAIQGKGYENISFLGGPSVAQLYFLDIENVSVFFYFPSYSF